MAVSIARGVDVVVGVFRYAIQLDLISCRHEAVGNSGRYVVGVVRQSPVAQGFRQSLHLADFQRHGHGHVDILLVLGQEEALVLDDG